MLNSKQTILKNNWSDLVKLQTDFGNLNLWPTVDSRQSKKAKDVGGEKNKQLLTAESTSSVQPPIQISKKTADKIIKNSNSEKDTEPSLTPHTVTTSSTPKLTKKQRIKQKIKNKNVISINLSDLLKKKITAIDEIKTKKSTKPTFTIPSNKGIQKRKRGKIRENQLKKVLTPLKRNILLIRKQRRDLSLQPPVAVESYENQHPKTHSTNEQTVESPAVKRPLIVHSRRFRPYCDNLISPELCTAVEALLSELFRFQDRAYKKNEIKGRAKRRYVVGFKEVIRNLETRKTKLLIVAPDIEPSLEFVEVNNGDGESIVAKIKRIAVDSETPYVFSVGRRKIGYLLHKKVMVSCVAILNYEGADEHYRDIIRLVELERVNFKENVAVSQ